MADLIDRQALFKQIEIDSEGIEGSYGDTWKFIDTIKNMPSVDVATDLQPENRLLQGCKDIISRQQAIDALNDEYHGMISDESMKIYQIINWLDNLPSAEPQERTGYWIYDGFNHTHGIEWCHCSKCGNCESVDSVYTQVDIYPYCAKCGCKMEGTDDCDR